MEAATLARPRTTRHIGPSLNCEDVAVRLNYTPQWIANLSNKPLDNPDRLNAYYQEGGAWHLKPPGKLNTKEWSNRPLFFYEEDVKEWEERHPLKSEQEQVEYTEQEKEEVLEAANHVRENGVVKRAAVMRYLNEKHGYKKWRTNTYAKVAKILEDAGIPTPYAKSAQRREYKQLRKKYVPRYNRYNTKEREKQSSND